MRFLTVLAATACCLPLSVHALSCAPVTAEQIASSDATVIVGQVTSSTTYEKKQDNYEPDTHYKVHVLQSWRGAPKAGETITVTGKSIGPWGAQKLETTEYAYLLVLDKTKPIVKPVTGKTNASKTAKAPDAGYEFGACSEIWQWNPTIDTMISLNRLLNVPAPVAEPQEPM